MHIPIFGNGDVTNGEQALEKKNKYGVDGIMIGRASIGYPWVFNEIKAYLKDGTHLAPPSIEERADVCIRHLEFSLKWKGPILGIVEMRRHYTNYFKGYPHFKPYRQKLVTSDSAQEIFDLLNRIPDEYSMTQAT